MAHIQLAAEERTQLGTSATRRLRRQGRVPGVLYQAGGPSLAFSLLERELRQVFHGGGRSQVIEITIGGGTALPALLKDWQMEPVREEVLHVDLQQVDLRVAVETSVGVVLTGQAVGVREGNGVLDQTLRSVTVRALPDRLPESVEGDVTPLEVGGTLLVGDLVAPEGVEILDDPETTVASVLAPTVVEEPEEAVEVEEGAEPAPAAAPEAAPEPEE
jgi:large subunit ribosomal protein L25